MILLRNFVFFCFYCTRYSADVNITYLISMQYLCFLFGAAISSEKTEIPVSSIRFLLIV